MVNLDVSVTNPYLIVMNIDLTYALILNAHPSYMTNPFADEAYENLNHLISVWHLQTYFILHVRCLSKKKHCYTTCISSLVWLFYIR